MYSKSTKIVGTPETTHMQMSHTLDGLIIMLRLNVVHAQGYCSACSQDSADILKVSYVW